MKATRALFVEDDPRFREALGILLRGRPFESQLVGTAREALAAVDTFAPDVCVVDLGLPDLRGEELIRELSKRRPSLPIVVLTVAMSRDEIVAAFRAGAIGYLLKEDVGDRIGQALHEALDGGAPMSGRVARMVLGELRTGAPDAARPNAARSQGVLTTREVQVIESLSRGLSYADVATCLDISPNTVRAHVRSIYDKLAVASKTEAVLEALRLGVIHT